jgi:hypothetical protein
MKLFAVSLSLIGFLLPVAAAQAGSDAPYTMVSQYQIEHGGGCRKSSPAGQCCHAGSKPLHCH